jgi:hypothetical protein
VEPDFNKQISDLENYMLHNKRGPVQERSYTSNRVIHHYPGGSFVMGGP